MASKSEASRKRRAEAGTKAAGKAARAGGKVRPEQDVRPDERVTGSVLERGDLFFFYRPDVDETSPAGLVDVRRFHIVLRPEGRETLRLIAVGRKTLPEAIEAGRSHWAFVDRVFETPDALREALAGTTYETDTLGQRTLPEARPAGEGVYALVRRGRNTILAYALELPEEPGEVQRAFHIEREGRFGLAVKNPEAGSPAGVGLDGDRRADFPEELKARFRGRRWVAADPPAFLDHEGAELVLIGGREASEDLGIDLEPQPEDESESELFEVLRPGPGSERRIRPLFEGAWA